ncbi:LysR family transcriptional regulator [Nocardioides sp. KC13]|uniref:LysR family transcriptional regulator n=1 Tax=Nocardioides turkmenicus TaxID=2711220 RepID=A0A6M1QUW4_9ACTN|nr:LysR family transcriptional regulator [Nocardioides sp. KC13]NGN91624.1 LysR family transcriptional regulator [Nocardioides sp. KC13]
METRELRYFVAVAEDLHFSRAAARLGIAQPPLSRAISRLERRLGGPLLERNSRGVTLTDAGRVLLAEARAALDAIDAAERRTRRATGDGADPGLVLVSKAGAATELLTKLLDAYAAEPGSVKVEVDLCGIGEQGPRLRDGRADVALLHLPFDSVDGLDSEELLTEGQVAVLPSGHPWATRSELTLADLDGIPGLPPMRWPSGEGGTFSDGRGPEVRDSAQLYQLIGLGRAYALLPESARAEQHHGIATVPVSDAPEVTTVIAWPQHSRSLALAALVQTATRL